MNIQVKQTFEIRPITEEDKEKHIQTAGNTVALVFHDGVIWAFCRNIEEARSIISGKYPDYNGWEVSEPYA